MGWSLWRKDLLVTTDAAAVMALTPVLDGGSRCPAYREEGYEEPAVDHNVSGPAWWSGGWRMELY